MSDWMQLLLAIVGSSTLGGGIVGGIGWWVKTRHDDRVAKELAYVAEIKALNLQIFNMQQDRIQIEMTRASSSDQTMKVLGEMLALLKAGKAPPA